MSTRQASDENDPPIESRDQLVRPMANGEKPRARWRIGTEHEKIVYSTRDRHAPSYDEPGGIRDLLLAELQHRGNTHLWLRCTWPQRYRGAKAAVIGLLGAKALRRQLRLRGLHYNSDFAGVYDLVSESGYDTRLRGWLAGLADGGVLMCHPELPGPHTSAARAAEHRYLASPHWLALQEETRVCLKAPTA